MDIERAVEILNAARFGDSGRWEVSNKFEGDDLVINHGPPSRLFAVTHDEAVSIAETILRRTPQVATDKIPLAIGP